NSPTLCQLYVDAALQPLRAKWRETVIYHYMDDILFAQPSTFEKQQLEEIRITLANASLFIAPEKVQLTTPWRYLGWIIAQQVIRPQKLQLQTKITNLNQAQKLLGDLQWLKPIVGIPNTLLEQLRPLLRGTDPTAPVHIAPSQQAVLQQIVRQVETGFVSRRLPDSPVALTIWNTPCHLLGALTQVEKKTGEHRVLEWISLPLQSKRTIETKPFQIAALIQKGRLRTIEVTGTITIEVTGTEPTDIYLPMRKDDLDWYLLNSADLQMALLGAGAQVHTGPLQPKQMQWLQEWDWVVKPLRSETPLANAVTVFTDAGKRSRKAAATWKEGQQWLYRQLEADSADSLQTLELAAVVWAIETFNQPLNVVTDSFYVAGVAQRIEDASVKEVQNKRLYQLLLQLKRAVADRSTPYCIIHIRSHKWDSGL
ncbi:PO113 protein, partial [Burhinus bistriatus]|nr:PO113 protein [Burhinus bistriatus]